MKAPITVVGRYYNQQGGVSNVMAQLAMRAASNYDVSVASNEFLDWDTKLAKIPVPMLARPKWAQVPSFAIAAGPRVRAQSPSLIHSHDPQFLGADLYTAHSCFRSYINSQRSGASLPKRLLSHAYLPHISGIAMSNIIYNPTSLIVAVSGSIKSEIISEHAVPAENIRVVYNGVDAARFSRIDGDTARKAVGAELGLDLRAKMVLIFVGYEFDRKRLDVALRALADLRSKDCHLLVVGGADATRYRALTKELGVEDQVSFLGHRADVPTLLRASDVFVFPTKYEAASLAILEAAAAGLAIVTSDVAMAAEVFTDGVDALLVPNQDRHEAVAASLSRLLSDRELRNRLGVGAARLAARFSWDRIWQEYDDIYLEVLNRKEMGRR